MQAKPNKVTCPMCMQSINYNDLDRHVQSCTTLPLLPCPKCKRPCGRTAADLQRHINTDHKDTTLVQCGICLELEPPLFTSCCARRICKQCSQKHSSCPFCHHAPFEAVDTKSTQKNNSTEELRTAWYVAVFFLAGIGVGALGYYLFSNFGKKNISQSSAPPKPNRTRKSEPDSDIKSNSHTHPEHHE